ETATAKRRQPATENEPMRARCCALRFFMGGLLLERSRSESAVAPPHRGRVLELGGHRRGARTGDADRRSSLPRAYPTSRVISTMVLRKPSRSKRRCPPVFCCADHSMIRGAPFSSSQRAAAST